MQHVLYAFYLYFINRWISYLPFQEITILYFTVVYSKKLESRIQIYLMGFQKFGCSSNFEIGNNNVVNKDVFLDGRGGKIIIWK